MQCIAYRGLFICEKVSNLVGQTHVQNNNDDIQTGNGNDEI